VGVKDIVVIMFNYLKRFNCQKCESEGFSFVTIHCLYNNCARDKQNDIHMYTGSHERNSVVENWNLETERAGRNSELSICPTCSKDRERATY